MGSFISRALLMFLGYAYPAYACFKEVEKKKKKPEIEQLEFWCQYWILVAMFTVCERVGDAFISWFPMYSEAKLVFFIYLWHPKTKGTSYVYNVFLRPYVANHETEIDGTLLNLKIKSREMGLLFWEEAAIYVQTRVFDVLKYFSSHSVDETSRIGATNNYKKKPFQQQQQEPGAEPASPNHFENFISSEQSASVASVSSSENGNLKQESYTLRSHAPRGKWRRLLFRNAAQR